MEELFFPVTRREAERQGIQYSSEKNRNTRFPSLLRELRDGMGQSQAELSKKLGVSKSTVGFWETGDTLPDAKAIRDIADYFDVSTDFLLGRTDLDTSNMDLRKVCEYMGLTQETGEMMLEVQTAHMSWVFNEIVSNPSFYEMLEDITEHSIQFLKIRKHFSQKDKDKRYFEIEGIKIPESTIFQATLEGLEMYLRRILASYFSTVQCGDYEEMEKRLMGYQAKKE